MYNEKQAKRAARNVSAIIKNDPNIPFGSFHRSLEDKGIHIPYDILLSVYLFATGKAIHEVVLAADHPSVEFIRFMDLDTQRKYLSSGETFDLVVKNNEGEFVTEKRTFKELTEEECMQLFKVTDSVEYGRSLLYSAKLHADRMREIFINGYFSVR